MENKTATGGNVFVEDIKVGDIHYEIEYGIGIAAEVISKPERTQDGKYAQWRWKSKVLNGETVIDYLVTEGMSHYAPKLYTELPEYIQPL